MLYKKWSTSNNLSESEKEEISQYTEEQKSRYFSKESFKFGTSGIREIVGLGTTRLNRFTYRYIGIAYAKFLKNNYKNPSALIFHDNRKQSEEFSLEVASKLREEGVEVYIPEKNILLPTPILSFLIRKLKLTGGINITASHNPTEYNGIKMYNHTGKQIAEKEEIEISNYMRNAEEIIDIPESNKQNFKEINLSIIEDYFENIEENLPKLNRSKNIKCLFSSHHGTTGKWMKKLAEKMGFDNFIEFEEECNVTWKLNENEISNPEYPKSFSEQIKKADELNIKYIFASDPDGDRSAIAEKQENGEWYFFNGNEMGILSAYFKNKYAPKEKSYIVSTYVTNDFLKKVFPNIPIHLTKTGFKNISQKIEEEENKGNNLLIAFEEAIGSLLIPSHREKDGFQQISLVLEMISYLESEKITIKKYLDNILEEFGHWKGFTDVYLVDKSKLEDIKKIKIPEISPICWNEDLQILEWNLGENGWIKFRYSGTEPKLKAYYNLFGKNKEDIDGIIDKFKNHIQNILL